MPTFRAKLEVKETRVKSGFHEGLGAKTHWNFRYNAPLARELRPHYENLPAQLEAEGIKPEVPWLYNFKLDFRFK